MVLEVADLRIDPAKKAEFEIAIERGVREIISKGKGFRKFSVQRCVETAGRYLLMIEWETLENHMKDFRESPAFTEWRAIVGPFFVAPVVMEHFELVTQS